MVGHKLSRRAISSIAKVAVIGGLVASATIMTAVKSSPVSAACWPNQALLFELTRYDNLVLVDPRPSECSPYSPVRRLDGTDPLVNQEVWRGPH